MKPILQTPATKLKPIIQQAESLADLYVTEFEVHPSRPTNRDVIEIRIGIFNQGSGDADAFTVEWWPGENYPAPGCTWRIEKLGRNGGRILECSGYVYPSSYTRINTVVKVDTSEDIEELDETNNVRVEEIQVLK